MIMEFDGDTGMIEVKQLFLAYRIIKYLLQDVKTKKGNQTPAQDTTFVKDEGGEPPTRDFRYRSVVGILLYLDVHSRHEIAYEVNCAASCMFSQKYSHELELNRIV